MNIFFLLQKVSRQLGEPGAEGGGALRGGWRRQPGWRRVLEWSASLACQQPDTPAPVAWPALQPDGRRVLVTPPLTGTILPGVTRDSILQLARSWGEFDVEERAVTIAEVRQVGGDG
jgi:hypothetical protein